MIYQKKFTLLQNSVYPFFWHQLQDVLAMHGQARTISNCDVKIDLRRIGIWGLNGVCHVSEQRGVLKRHSLASVLSLLSCFFCLDSLFWHGLASLNLVISTQHHYSAQMDFGMHQFKLFPVMHWDIIKCLVSHERRENTLDNEVCSLIKSCVAMKISHW